MKNVPIGLWGAQIVAVSAMLIAAAIKTESILITGPILAIIGLLLALVTQPLQSWSTLLFALSGPLVGAIIAFMIAVFDMGPDEGHTPTLIILVLNLIATSPLAFMSYRRIRRWATSITFPMPPVLQFSMKTLLIVMTTACVLIGVCKFLFSDALRDEAYVFGGYTLVVIVLSGIVTWRNLTYPYRRNADGSRIPRIF